MEFSPLTADDIAGVQSWCADVELRPDMWRDVDTRSVALHDRGLPIAVGLMWRSQIHDTRYWAQIVVDPALRRQGLGTRVFEHLGSLRASPLPFISRGFNDSVELAFAEALGARTIQVVPPREVDLAERRILRRLSGTHAGIATALAALTRAHAEMYEWIHASWSPVGPGFAGPLMAAFEQDVDVEATAFISDHNGRILALCAVYSDGAIPVLSAETTSREEPEGERLVEACVRASLDVLAARGMSRVDFDGHVTDPHFLPVWTRLRPTGRWFRLLEIDAQPHEG